MVSPASSQDPVLFWAEQEALTFSAPALAGPSPVTHIISFNTHSTEEGTCPGAPELWEQNGARVPLSPAQPSVMPGGGQSWPWQACLHHGSWQRPQVRWPQDASPWLLRPGLCMGGSRQEPGKSHDFPLAWWLQPAWGFLLSQGVLKLR